MNKSEQIKEEIVQMIRQFALDHPHINSPLVNKAKELEIALLMDSPIMAVEESRLEIFEKYIHTEKVNENDWSAFFTSSGESGDYDNGELPDYAIYGCRTEKEAIQKLIDRAEQTFVEKGWVD